MLESHQSTSDQGRYIIYIFYVVIGILFIYTLFLISLSVMMILLGRILSGFSIKELVPLGVDGIGIIFEILLTAGLLYIYFQIRDIQRMERRAIVELANYSLEGNSVEIWLSNYGKGSAIDLELEFDIIEPSDAAIDIKSDFVPLQRSSDKGVRRETSLPPEQEAVKTQATPRLRVKEGTGEFRSMDWGAAVKPIHDSGIDEIQYVLKVHYSNQLGEKDSIILTPEGRGADISIMSRLEKASHGVPIGVTDPSDISLNTKLIPTISQLITDELVGDASIKILQILKKEDRPLPVSEIGVFQSEDLEKRVCDGLVDWGLLEKYEEKSETTIYGQNRVPARYSIAEKGRDFLDRI